MNDPSRTVPIFLPSFGASIEEGTIVSWMVSVGDSVRAGQVIAEIETEKATIELEATEDGVIEAIVVSEGDPPVPVGTTIARLTRPDADLGETATAGEHPSAPDLEPHDEEGPDVANVPATSEEEGSTS